jgi:Ni/Fe-hydrogenase subunit HybB-like protein
VLLFLLTLLLTFRLWDMVKHGVFRYLQGFSYVTSMWWLEMLLCFAVPMFLLRNERLRHHPGHLFYAAATHILGFILNRLNVSMTAFQQPGIPPYTPSLMEFAVTGAVISFHFVAFALAVKYLDIFPEVSIKEKVGVLRPRKPVSS